ncbi:MAG: hypothetical protein ACYDHH_13940 [Solirubrobacteraceae bacterium]
MVALALAQPLPSLVRVGQRLAVSGRAAGAPAGTTAELEYRGVQGQAPQSWTVLAKASVGRHGAFKLSWLVRRPTPLPLVLLRVAAVRRGRVLAASKPAQTAIGSAQVRCAAPVPPAVNIPVGDGWIEGGLYIRGGAFPGVDQCASQSYTVTATNTATGAVAATQTVAGGHSYTLVVPAGTYALTTSDGGCPGSSTATVTAAKGTTADSFCNVP